jgi:predicted nucleic acid-binding protein
VKTALLDTNILLFIIRSSLAGQKLSEHFSSPLLQYISVVNFGEIKSLAFQLNWGKHKIERMYHFLSQTVIIDINYPKVIDAYAEIDAYSKNKLAIKGRFLGKSVTMGKNDLWIAATASVFDLPLLTTDSDFSHLDEKFLKIERMSVTMFRE